MRIKIFIVLFIIATVGISLNTVIGKTPVSDNTKVQEALADSLNDNGRWIKQHYTEGAAQSTPPSGTAVIYFKTDGKPYSKDDAGTESDLTAGGGTIDGTGTTNEIMYWVDSNTAGALAVATYPSLTELSYSKGVTSAIQTQLGLKAPLASPTFTGTVTLPVGLTGVVRTDTGVVSVDTDVTDLVTAASLTVAGKAELATTAEINAGTDTTRAMPVDQFEASNYGKRTVSILLNDATVLTSGDGKAYFRIPDELAGWSITQVRAARTAGNNNINFDLYNVTQGTDTLSTAVWIDGFETDSNSAGTSTAINTAEDDATLYDRYRVDCNVAGTDTTWAEVQVTFERVP